MVTTRPKPATLPPLENGDRLSCEEFWQRYRVAAAPGEGEAPGRTEEA